MVKTVLRFIARSLIQGLVALIDERKRKREQQEKRL